MRCMCVRVCDIILVVHVFIVCCVRDGDDNDSMGEASHFCQMVGGGLIWEGLHIAIVLLILLLWKQREIKSEYVVRSCSSKEEFLREYFGLFRSLLLRSKTGYEYWCGVLNE